MAFSVCAGKSYVGWTGNIERRLIGHHFTAISAYTLQYHLLKLILPENLADKQEAIRPEKYFKDDNFNEGNEIDNFELRGTFHSPDCSP